MQYYDKLIACFDNKLNFGLEQIFILVDICSNTTGFKHVLKRKRYRD